MGVHAPILMWFTVCDCGQDSNGLAHHGEAVLVAMGLIDKYCYSMYFGLRLKVAQPTKLKTYLEVIN